MSEPLKTLGKSKSSSRLHPQVGFAGALRFDDHSSEEGAGEGGLYAMHQQHKGDSKRRPVWWLQASKGLLTSNMFTSKDECTYCSGSKGCGGSCSGVQAAGSLQSIVQGNLTKKYSSNRDFYNLKIVNDLIYNENSHVVSIFKDYLILDDINEFLKRPYNQAEILTRLPKLCGFYDKYS